MTRTPIRKLSSEEVGSAFLGLVRESLRAQSVGASQAAEYYLVALLSQFIRMDPRRLEEPLGPALVKAAFAEPSLRHGQLKQVADTTLFLTGIFLDHVESRLADTEYYFAIGSSAYLHLDDLDAPAYPYRELGDRFEAFAGVLARIADTELFRSDDRLLTLYDRWLAKGNARDQARLVSLGVTPVAGDDELH